LDFIASELAHRLRKRQTQGAEWRNPAQTQAHGGTHVTEGNFVVFAVHIAHVQEREHTQGPVIASTRERSNQLGVQCDLLGAAQGSTGHITRAEGALVETTHRAQTARVEVLEHREWATVQALAVTGFAIEGNGEAFVERDVLLVLVVGPHIARIARHGPFGIEALVAAGVGRQSAVPIVITDCP